MANVFLPVLRPDPSSPEDIARARAMPKDSCPRRYCWWWHTLGFDWDIPVAQGCTYLSVQKGDDWPNANSPCKRSAPLSATDHFEPREPHLIEDGVVPIWHYRYDEGPMIQAERGHFVYASGLHGAIRIDVDGLFKNPWRLRPSVRELGKRLIEYDVEVICGPMNGGALLAQMIAMELDREFSFAEPRVQAANAPAGFRIAKSFRDSLSGRRVAIVDDVINAGSASKATYDDLVQCGAQPVVVGALLVLGNATEGVFGPLGIPVVGLEKWDAELWRADECPMCAAGQPLDEAF